MTNLDMFIGSLNSPHTKIKYRKNVQDLLDYTGKTEYEMTWRDIESWATTLNGKSDSYKHGKICSVKSFFKYLVKIHEIDIDPSSSLDTPTVKQAVKDYIPFNIAKTLIDYTNNPREKAIIAVYLSTGMRASELSAITLSDYQTKEYLAVPVKGGGYREFALNKDCRKYIDEYLKVRLNSGIPNLFVGNQGNPMATKNMGNTIKKICAKANLNGNFANHTFRHTFCTEMIERTGNIKDVQHLMGHKNDKTTEIYDHSNKDYRRHLLEDISLI